MYTVQYIYTVVSVQCTLTTVCNVHCTLHTYLHSLHFTVLIICDIVYGIYCIVYGIHASVHKLYTIQCTIYSNTVYGVLYNECTLHSVQCTLYTVQCTHIYKSHHFRVSHRCSQFSNIYVEKSLIVHFSKHWHAITLL